MMTDIVCFLSKCGFGTYHEIMKVPVHVLIQAEKWYKNDIKEELKAKRDYDIAFAKAFRCPLSGKLK